MNSPRSGFRRTAAAAWALAGIGVAGVAGASALAYADTVKPAPEAAPTTVEPAPTSVEPAPFAPPPPAVDVQAAPPVQPAAPPPVAVYTPAPAYTPAYVAPPAQAYVAPPTQAYVAPPAPVYVAPPVVPQQVQAPAPQPSSSGGFPIRQSHVPLGGGGSSSGNKFTPSHTASRGS